MLPIVCAVHKMTNKNKFDMVACMSHIKTCLILEKNEKKKLTNKLEPLRRKTTGDGIFFIILKSSICGKMTIPFPS